MFQLIIGVLIYLFLGVIVAMLYSSFDIDKEDDGYSINDPDFKLLILVILAWPIIVL